MDEKGRELIHQKGLEKLLTFLCQCDGWQAAVLHYLHPKAAESLC